MHVLHITHFDADAIGGSPDRARGVALGLRANGHRIDNMLLPVRKPPWAPRHLPWWFLRPSRRWAERVHAAAGAVDVVVASHLPSAWATVVALGTQRPRFIYDAHNDELRLVGQYRSRRYGQRVAALEQRVVEFADAVWVAGDADCEALRRRFPSAAIHNVPSGAPLLADMSGIAARGSSAYVYDSWGYEPNRDGLRRLAGTPTAVISELHVFGRMPDALAHNIAALAWRHQPNLEWSFPGFADTLESMVDSARGPGLLPVWIGGGTRLRAVQIAVSR